MFNQDSNLFHDPHAYIDLVRYWPRGVINLSDTRLDEMKSHSTGVRYKYNPWFGQFMGKCGFACGKAVINHPNHYLLDLLQQEKGCFSYAEFAIDYQNPEALDWIDYHLALKNHRDSKRNDYKGTQYWSPRLTQKKRPTSSNASLYFKHFKVGRQVIPYTHFELRLANNLFKKALDHLLTWSDDPKSLFDKVVFLADLQKKYKSLAVMGVHRRRRVETA